MFVLLVDAQREGVLAVDIGLDDRIPALVKVLLELADQRRRVHRKVARHDQQRLVATLPELRNCQRHKAQHATGALELVETGPVDEQPVEEFRVDRVRELHSAPVFGLTGSRGEVAVLSPVHLAERPDDAVTDPRLVCRDRVEEATAHNLE